MSSKRFSKSVACCFVLRYPAPRWVLVSHFYDGKTPVRASRPVLRRHRRVLDRHGLMRALHCHGRCVSWPLPDSPDGLDHASPPVPARRWPSMRCQHCRGKPPASPIRDGRYPSHARGRDIPSRKTPDQRLRDHELWSRHPCPAHRAVGATQAERSSASSSGCALPSKRVLDSLLS